MSEQNKTEDGMVVNVTSRDGESPERLAQRIHAEVVKFSRKAKPPQLSELYRGNLKWLPERTIYFARHGSHSYGTNIATSDEDFRGVAIAPRECYLGSQNRFEQAESKDPDLTIFDLRKFLALASQANPNVIEILFVDDADRIKVSPAGERLLAARDFFLSRRIRHTFAGYAHSQMGRIDRHYRWLKRPPTHQPTRAEFDLPERTLIPKDQLAAAESAVKHKLDSWSADFLDDLDRDVRLAILQRMATHLAELQIATDTELWKGAGRVIGYDENFILLLDRERRYTAAKREWDQFEQWKATRNPARAALEAKWGYDTKHAAHLVRLLRMCRECLETGKLQVKRPDAAELLEIRHGAWTYERLAEWSATENGKLDELAAKSPLPRAPDIAKIDALCVEMIGEAIQ